MINKYCKINTTVFLVRTKYKISHLNTRKYCLDLSLVLKSNFVCKNIKVYLLLDVVSGKPPEKKSSGCVDELVSENAETFGRSSKPNDPVALLEGLGRGLDPAPEAVLLEVPAVVVNTELRRLATASLVEIGLSVEARATPGPESIAAKVSSLWQV